MNELLLATSIVVLYGTVVLLYRFFGREGLFCWMVIATILANVEVLRVIDAFGIEQTLGNVLFASTLLVTDILNEKEGKKTARKAAWLGITSAVMFVLISQSWLLYIPSDSDWAGESFETIFSIAPRVVTASVIVYAICQLLDIWLYRRIWTITTAMCGDEKRFLWVRNNASALIVQAVNTILYNFAAFYGIYSISTLINICIGCYIIFVITSICDTPALYIARRISPKN